jgi:BirA family biotin operon repressor/biotin-[acetyl-CoA-carboxylase] ligase
MAEVLGLSRAAVAKAMAVLRRQGFAIDAKPWQGYRLRSEPEAPLPARLEARLPSGCLGLPVRHYARIDSTNLEARRWAEEGAPHGALVVAEFQSAGRGRLSRRWSAPAGSCLLFSLILRPRLELGSVFALTLVASLAVCRALEAEGLAPAIKWPNDVFLEGRKLAGVLTEFTSRAEQVDHVVLGVGLNVNLSAADLARLPAPAASLSAASGHAWDRGALLASILIECHDLVETLVKGQGDLLKREYDQRHLLAGRRVLVRDGDQQRRGRVAGLTADGGLILKQDGREVVIRHGDVSLLAME